MAYAGIMDKDERKELHGDLLKAFKHQAGLADNGCSDRATDVKAAMEASKLATNMIRIGQITVEDHETIHSKLKAAFKHHAKIANDGANSKSADIEAATAVNALTETLLDLDGHAKKRGFVPPIQ